MKQYTIMALSALYLIRLKLFKDGRIVNDEDVGNSSLLEHRHDNFDEEYEDIQKELERLRLGK